MLAIRHTNRFIFFQKRPSLTPSDISDTVVFTGTVFKFLIHNYWTGIIVPFACNLCNVFCFWKNNYNLLNTYCSTYITVKTQNITHHKPIVSK